jgi:hypothetical protein
VPCVKVWEVDKVRESRAVVSPRRWKSGSFGHRYCLSPQLFVKICSRLMVPRSRASRNGLVGREDYGVFHTF